MKFSNALCYSMMPCDTLDDLPRVEAALAAMAFVPCGKSSDHSTGFVPPREAEGALVEAIDGQLIVKLSTESRSVPASAVRRAMDERVKQIEESTGRKPGKKEKAELKQDVTAQLLPQAFSKFSTVTVWIDRKRGLLVLDTASASKSDNAVTMLVRAIENLTLCMVSTRMAPDTAMGMWLLEQEPPPGFTIDRDCELRATNESKSVVKYANHPLDVPEVVEHVKTGMRPVRLAMTFDDRVSFVLTDSGSLRSLTFIDGTESQDKAADTFDADVAITTATLAELFGALTEALGGAGQSTIFDTEGGAEIDTESDDEDDSDEA